MVNKNNLIKKRRKGGFFIVIDGTDGSGKTQQTALLEKKLRTEGRKVKTIDFPRYGKGSAYFVEEYLNKRYGSPNEVGPYRGSIFYALDRFHFAKELKGLIDEGYIVVSNRYTSSNMGHQAGKIANKAERNVFLKWLDNFEFELLNIPRPNLNVLLFMPPLIGRDLVLKKGRRTYISNGKRRDAHEEDKSHLINASEAYVYVAKKYKWPIINCVENGNLRDPNLIHEDLYQICKNYGM